MLRRNPVRAQAVRAPRHAKLVPLQALVAQYNPSLTAPPRAKVQGAGRPLGARAKTLRRADWVELTVAERARTLMMHEDAQTEAAKLDGCYVRQTALTPAQANTARVQERSKDRASVEPALRTCQTTHLAGRPICVRLAARTRAQAFVVRLAYQLIPYRASCWSALDGPVAEGLQALATRCLVEVSPPPAPSYHCSPTPRDARAALLHRADIKLPKAFSLSGTRGSTKKKRQSERLVQ